MTTRRDFLAVSGGVLAASALAGCRDRGTAATPPAVVPAAAAVPDVVLAAAGDGFVRLTGTRAQALGGPAALSRDGSVVYRADDTNLTRVNAATGASVRSITLGGGWVPRVVSAAGDACVLTQNAAGDPPAARTTSPLLVVAGDGRRKYNLTGVVEPDAFTTDGTGLFVLEWLPATLPDHYRVRLLDLRTGEVQPLLTRDKAPVPAGAEEEMRGEGRQAVLSGDRKMLYTLYTHQPGHLHTRDLLAGGRAGVHAFVHVLHLEQRWAYCLDLPEPFGASPAERYALAADGRHIAVLDGGSGLVLYASATSFAIEKVARLRQGGTGAGSLALGRDDRVYACAGDTVEVLDRGSDESLARRRLPGDVRGLRLNADGSRLYAGQADAVVWLDATTGETGGRAVVEGLTDVRHVL